MNFQDKIGAIFNSGGCYEFIDGDYENQNVELIEDLTKVEYDSYGSEDSKLRFIFRCKEYDKFFEIVGTRCSYVGEEYTSCKEVKQKEKTITIWE